MKVRYFVISLIACIVMLNIKTLSQSAGINFILAFPQGEFKENIDRLGYGVGGEFMILTPKQGSPFGIGINAGFINYGSETRREPFSLTIPDVTVDVSRSNNLINFHLMFRIAPYAGKLRPYLEGFFGGAYIYTETTIKSQGEEEVASSTNFDDFAWNYGAGGGVMYEVYRNNDDGSALFIDLKVRYLLGTEAEYLKEGSVIIDNGQVTYEVSKSKTDLLTAQLGVIYFFAFH
ncbi:MAG: hypothetical protein PVF17_02665 [Ignavibacteria bacterium]|jgi:hypothetical protein